MFQTEIPSFVFSFIPRSLTLLAGGLPAKMIQAKIYHSDCEIIELAGDEGHDAEISTNAGFLLSDPEKPSSRRVSMTKSLSGDKEIDIEKEVSTRRQSSSSCDGEAFEEEAADPNTVSWDGLNDPQKYCY